MFRQLLSCYSSEIQDVFSSFHLTQCFLFCFVPPPQKVVNKSKVRRTGSRNLEARKHGIPSPSFDYALFSLHFLSICLHIKYSEKNQICLKVTLNSPLPLPSSPHNCLPGDWGWVCTSFQLFLYTGWISTFPSFLNIYGISTVKCHFFTKVSLLMAV